MSGHGFLVGPIVEAQAREAIPSRGWLKGYVAWAEQATDANLAYHLIGGLIALSQSVPIEFSIPFGNKIYAPIFGLLIGASTEARKSSAISLCERIVSLALPKRVGAEPGSAEAVVDELAANPQQVVFITEYAATLAQTERGYANAIKSRWTHAYDCSPLGRVKANRKGVVVQTPRLSIFAGCAPGYVERHTEPVDWSEGFFARHTTIFANREREIPTPYSDAALEARLVEFLAAFSTVDGYSDQGGVGACAGFTDAAVKVRVEWEERLRALKREYAHLVNLPALGRAPTMAIKIAALLSWDWGLARQGMSWRIDDEAMLAAIKIIDLHVQSTITLGEWLAPTAQMRDRRKVLGLINGTPIRRGAVIRKAQLLKREADAILGTLLDEGTIKVATTVNAEPYYVLADEDRPDTITESAPLLVSPSGEPIDPSDYD